MKLNYREEYFSQLSFWISGCIFVKIIYRVREGEDIYLPRKGSRVLYFSFRS